METKASVRTSTAELVNAYLANGGEIKRAPDRAGRNLSGQDWSRIAKGEKVATAEEIEAERNRRLTLAVNNADVDLCAALLNGRHDRAIKFDIENGRLGPNGEIR